MNTRQYLKVAIFLLFSPGFSHSLAAQEGGCGFSLEAQFIESAPRDSFRFTNSSEQPWSIAAIQLDMTNSSGKLLFDTVDGGEGVEVFQPFRVSDTSNDSNPVTLEEMPKLVDGDQRMFLSFSQFPPGGSFTFTIDVDDSLTDSELGQIRVSGGEIAGTVLSVTLAKEGAESFTLEGVYDTDSIVSVVGGAC